MCGPVREKHGATLGQYILDGDRSKLHQTLNLQVRSADIPMNRKVLKCNIAIALEGPIR